MSDADGIRNDRLRGKEAGQAGDARASQSKSEELQRNLSLTEIMSLREKHAKSQTEAGSQALSPDKSSNKASSTVFGSNLTKHLDEGLSQGQLREFKWLAARGNFRELPKLYGRKFLQLGKGDNKKEEEIKEADSKLKERTLLNASKKADELVETPHQRLNAAEKKEPQELPDSEVEENAIDLDVETIYNEKDYLEEIKLATELSLGIDDSHNQGKKVFKDLEKIHPHDSAAAASNASNSVLSRKRLRECINNFSGGKVIVIGDLLIDELIEGRPERISREAPVLILEHMETELIPGGAANTAHNVTALGGKCHALGVCGKDEYAAKLAHLLDKFSISHSLIQDPSRPTTVKTRILSKAHAIRQQLIRLDRISHAIIDGVVQSLLVERLERTAANYGAMILSDYQAGVIADSVVDASRRIAAEHNMLYVVDAQCRFERFQGATLLTPNQPDAEKAVGYAFNTPEKLAKGGQELLLLTGAKAILLTRGPEGMVLFRPGQTPFHLPVFNRSEVFDVTGAGDTVVATMTLALVTGATPEEATALGNLAAGIVVRKSGTAVTSQQELMNNLELVTLAEE